MGVQKNKRQVKDLFLTLLNKVLFSLSFSENKGKSDAFILKLWMMLHKQVLDSKIYGIYFKFVLYLLFEQHLVR